jgi:hypothetical protein
MRCKCREPSLTELMRDPIVKAVMACDAVKETELRHLIERVRRRYAGPIEQRRPA